MSKIHHNCLILIHRVPIIWGIEVCACKQVCHFLYVLSVFYSAFISSIIIYAIPGQRGFTGSVSTTQTSLIKAWRVTCLKRAMLSIETCLTNATAILTLTMHWTPSITWAMLAAFPFPSFLANTSRSLALSMLTTVQRAQG